MKKFLLPLITLISCLNIVSGSHLMGGQITAAWLGTGFDYQVTMTLYRDTIGIPMYPTEDINISADTIAGTSPVIYTINAPPAINFGNGVEEYTYQLNVSFPAAGDYVIYWRVSGVSTAFLE
ncbi:MAG: hypothetical protein ACKOA1_04205 [Bacteroidota bacterium]